MYWGQYEHFVSEGGYNISTTDPITCTGGGRRRCPCSDFRVSETWYLLKLCIFAMLP